MAALPQLETIYKKGLPSAIRAWRSVNSRKQLVSEKIRLRAGDPFLFRSVDRIAPKGFAEKFPIFEPRGKRSECDDQECAFCDEWEEIYAVLDTHNAARSLERLEAFTRRHPKDGVARHHAEKLRKYLTGAAA